MNKEWFSAAELAGQPGCPGTPQGVNAKAKREDWQCQIVGRNHAREYHISSLPGATRAHLAAQTVNAIYSADAAERDGAIAGRRLNVAQAIDRRIEQRSREQVLSGLALLGGTRKARAEARLTILSALRDYQRERPEIPKTAAIKDFCVEYNARRLLDEAELHQLVRSISYDTINRWQKTIASGDTSGLTARYGNRKGTGKIDRQPELKRFCVAMLTDHPHASASHVHESIGTRFAGTDIARPSKKAVERWITTFRADNAQLLEAIANPDGWKNKYMTAYGSASEDVIRLNQRWELDGTPGDIELLDGRHQVIQAIDVYCRRMKLLVVPTQKAAHVAALLRRCILDWGVPESIKTDNGKDYTSHHIDRVVNLLDIDQKFSQKFSGWEKPHVERGFRTWSHDLVELMPGYIGHNVAEREALRARQSFSDRLFKKDEVVEVRMTAEELQQFCDDWVDNIYQHRAHDGLNGKTPFEVAAAWTGEIRRIDDERALDILLAEAPGDGKRTATKKGISIDTLQYIAPELGEIAGSRVAVRYDPTDAGRIYVFHEGAFYCTAECPELTGVSRKEIASEARQRQKKRVQAARRQLKADARAEKTADIAREIMAKKAEEAAQLTQFPKKSTPHRSAGLTAAMDAARAGELPRQRIPLPASERAALVADIAAHREPDPATLGTVERYRYWCQLEARRAAGEKLSDKAEQFHAHYQTTADWRAFREVEADLGSGQALAG